MFPLFEVLWKPITMPLNLDKNNDVVSHQHIVLYYTIFKIIISISKYTH